MCKIQNLQSDASSETSVHTKTQRKKKSATIANDIAAHDERQMQLRNIQSDDKTQFRVRLRHLANKYVLKGETLGPTLGVIQTGSENQRNPNGSNNRGKIHRMDLAHGRKSKDISLNSKQKRVQNSRIVF